MRYNPLPGTAAFNSDAPIRPITSFRNQGAFDVRKYYERQGVYATGFVEGDEHIPTEGAAILVCNHVSFVDAVLLMAASPRPIRFIMDHQIFRIPVLGAMFKLAKAIPIAPQKVDPATYENAFAEARRVLDDGDLLCIFPEGALTRDGALQPFKGGIMKILETHPVPVIPLALSNLWGSFFSRVHDGKAMTRPFRRGFFTRVGLVAGSPEAAAAVTPEKLQLRVAGLLQA